MMRPQLVVLAMTLLSAIGHAQDAGPGGCLPIDKAGYVITKPGSYCITKDLDTRLDFADHSAENSIVEITVGDVTVDMRGHRIGRGRLVTQRGGNGFLISTKQPDYAPTAAPRIENVTIRNGTLSDFGVGVFFFANRYQFPTLSHQVRRARDHSFIYDEANIVMENLTFEHCGEDMNFQDWVTR